MRRWKKSAEEHKLPPRIICTTPERVAKAAVKAIYRNRRLVTVEPFAKFMYAMKRFAPWLIGFHLPHGRAQTRGRKMAQLETGGVSLTATQCAWRSHQLRA